MTSNSSPPKEVATEEKKVAITSPCSRFEKMDKTMENLIGAGSTFLGMDLEEGTEVLWIEMALKANAQFLATVKQHFDVIVPFKHPSLLKCHTYWVEEKPDKSFVVYVICELIHTTLVHFIKRTRLNKKVIPLKTQIRYCKQMLLGLKYLKGRYPPFFLPNLHCRTVFIAHDGSIKVSTIVPNKRMAELLSEQPVKSEPLTNDVAMAKSLHNFAYIIYSLATIDLASVDLAEALKTLPNTNEAAGVLNTDHHEIIQLCLKGDVSITNLLNTRMLYEFPSLKRLAANTIIRSGLELPTLPPDRYASDRVFAEHLESKKQIYFSDVPVLDLQKYVGEVRHSIYNIKLSSGEMSHISTDSSDHSSVAKSLNSPYSPDPELQDSNHMARVIAVRCTIEKCSDTDQVTEDCQLRIDILFSNSTTRRLSTSISLETDTPEDLTLNLISNKLISPEYQPIIINSISRAIRGEAVTVDVPH